MPCRLLALVPFLGILVGTPIFNRVTPLILGLPLVLAWLVFCIVLTSVVMAVIHHLDSRARNGDSLGRVER